MEIYMGKKGISERDLKKIIKRRFKLETKLHRSENFLQNIKQIINSKEKFDKKIRKAVESAKDKLSSPILGNQAIINDKQVISSALNKNNDFISRTEEYIIAFDDYGHGDWENFLKRKLNNYELFLVIENKNAPEDIKDRAFEILSKQNPDKYDLQLIFAYCPEKYIKKAEEVLYKKKRAS
jgi:hypothetical protein